MKKKEKVPKRPGWLFIERYMPDATPEAQEEVYRNLQEVVKVLVEIDDRLVRETVEKPTTLKEAPIEQLPRIPKPQGVLQPPLF